MQENHKCGRRRVRIGVANLNLHRGTVQLGVRSERGGHRVRVPVDGVVEAGDDDPEVVARVPGLGLGLRGCFLLTHYLPGFFDNNRVDL